EQGSQTETEWREAKVRLDHLCTERDRMHIRLGQVDSDCVRLTQTVAEKETEFHEISGIVDSDKVLLEEIAEETAAIASDVQALRAKMDEVRGQRAEKMARFNALQRLKEEMDGFSKGTKALMKEAGLKNLYELITIPED